MKQKKTAALILVLLCMASLGGCKLLGDPARVMVIEQEGEYTLAPGYSEIYIQAKNVVIADAEVDKITVAEELEDADIRLENVEAELVTIMPGCTGKMEFSGNCGIEKVVLDQTGEMAVGMEDTASVETLHINDCGAVQIDGNCAVLENYSDDVALKGGRIEQA